MSKNLNQRFFAEFIALLAMTVDPDPNIEPEEPEINLSPEDIEKLRSNAASSSGDSPSSSEDGEDDDDGKKENIFSKMDEELESGAGDGGGGGGSSLTGKQRNLIKLGKHAKSANKNAMMAAAAMRRKR